MPALSSKAVYTSTSISLRLSATFAFMATFSRFWWEPFHLELCFCCLGYGAIIFGRSWLRISLTCSLAVALALFWASCQPHYFRSAVSFQAGMKILRQGSQPWGLMETCLQVLRPPSKTGGWSKVKLCMPENASRGVGLFSNVRFKVFSGWFERAWLYMATGLASWPEATW